MLDTWQNCLEGAADFKELIPEFYSPDHPDFLYNKGVNIFFLNKLRFHQLAGYHFDPNYLCCSKLCYFKTFVFICIKLKINAYFTYTLKYHALLQNHKCSYNVSKNKSVVN